MEAFDYFNKSSNISTKLSNLLTTAINASSFVKSQPASFYSKTGLFDAPDFNSFI